MKKILVVLLFCITAGLSISCQAQNTTTIDEGKYKLYSTKSALTFLKLNTQTGQVYQLEWAIDGNGDGEWIISDRKLNDDGVVQNGRFELYQTQYMLNFLLLDKNTGAVYQIEWEIEKDSCENFSRISKYNE